MNLSALLKSLVRNNVVSVSVQPPVARTKPLTWKNPRFADGMDAPVARPKVPGIGTPAPKESNGDYVTRLYRDLLGRAPDAGGYAAHMNGLATGTSRDALKQTFLDSAEYRDLHAAKPTPPPAVVPPEAPVAPIAPAPKLTEEQQFRKLIAADILSSGGRVANDADYAYWLPMLQSPCDSVLVTSGQMTGTEYYHRRLLGWQAKGDDAAKFGPYAVTGEQQGPVPSAIDVIGAAAPSAPPSAPQAPSETDQLRKLIAADIMTAGGRVATEADYSYWLPMLQSPCDSGLVTSGQMTGTEYYHRRILGWQAGGDDVAKFGPYAGGVERGPVPSAIEVMAR